MNFRGAFPLLKMTILSSVMNEGFFFFYQTRLTLEKKDPLYFYMTPCNTAKLTELYYTSRFFFYLSTGL